MSLVKDAASAAGGARSDASGDAIIEVSGLVKRYDGRAVLDGLDLRVMRGETVVVIGGSGSGKSTFARLLLGLERPDAGVIRVGDTDLASASDDDVAAARRRFAMVFQSHALLDSLTVYDNVAFPLREETSLDERTIRRRVTAMLTELGVEAAAERLPAELSGGMAKRVGIARAMVTAPESLVYDEPTSGLDPVTSRTVDGLIERMRERHLVTSIVITHDMVSAYHLADRVVMLARGKIAIDDAPERVFCSSNADIEPFARSSGLDLTHLAPRPTRRSAADIRREWASRAQR